jgi:hypothetical protein
MDAYLSQLKMPVSLVETLHSYWLIIIIDARFSLTLKNIKRVNPYDSEESLSLGKYLTDGFLICCISKYDRRRISYIVNGDEKMVLLFYISSKI